MYVGRFVVLGATPEGRPYLGYRVSSRSFPNRTITLGDDRAAVLPTPDAPPSDNPYIAYHCYRRHGELLVVGNGSHVDPIIEKAAAGYPPRDALALALLALDYEHDDYQTPRIAAALAGADGPGYLAIVSAHELLVQSAMPEPGSALLLATYERTRPTPIALDGDSAQALAQALMACEYQHPVAALAVLPGYPPKVAAIGP